MRQVMPHRNNIHLRRIGCKVFVSRAMRMSVIVTNLPQAFGAPFEGVRKYL